MSERDTPPRSSSSRLPWPSALLYVSLRIVGILPLVVMHAFGAMVGAALWIARTRARRIALRNLSLVLTQNDAETRHRLARMSVVETGKALAEMAAVWGRTAERALALIREVRGEALFDAARASGKGLIVAAPHLGCWELLNYWLAARTPLSIVYRLPRESAIEPLLLKARGHLPVEQVRASGAGVRALYRRLAEIEDERDIDSFAAELVDRFGPMPGEVEHLLQVVAIKALCRRANVEKLEAGPKGVVLSFRDNIFANPDGLMAFIQKQGSGVRMRADPKEAKNQQLVFFDDWEKPDDRLKGTAAILRNLAAIAERAKAA